MTYANGIARVDEPRSTGVKGATARYTNTLQAQVFWNGRVSAISPMRLGRIRCWNNWRDYFFSVFHVETLLSRVAPRNISWASAAGQVPCGACSVRLSIHLGDKSLPPSHLSTSPHVQRGRMYILSRTVSQKHETHKRKPYMQLNISIRSI